MQKKSFWGKLNSEVSIDTNPNERWAFKGMGRKLVVNREVDETSESFIFE